MEEEAKNIHHESTQRAQRSRGSEGSSHRGITEKAAPLTAARISGGTRPSGGARRLVLGLFALAALSALFELAIDLDDPVHACAGAACEEWAVEGGVGVDEELCDRERFR